MTQGVAHGGRNVIQRVVDAFAKGLGMVKESGSWYRHADSLVTILNLQKSQYAPRYYLNIAFWLMGLGSEGFPKENTAHVRIRLDVLLPDAADEITKLLDLGSGIADAQREEGLRALLNSRLRPILDRTTTVEDLRQLKLTGLLKGAAVRVAAREILDRASGRP